LSAGAFVEGGEGRAGSSFHAWVGGAPAYGVRVMKRMKPIKATRKHRFRLDEYDPNGDPERERRIAAHRRRIQRALKRHQS